MIQILGLADKDFTIPMINMLKKIDNKMDIMNKEMENANRILGSIK